MRFPKAVVKYRVPILILALVRMIPSVLGMAKPRINYHMLDYLPEDMETVIGQDALPEDFGKGAFSFLIVEDIRGKVCPSSRPSASAPSSWAPPWTTPSS